MDSNFSEGKILYFWDEHNIFVYIIPALIFFLLLYPVIINYPDISKKIEEVFSEKHPNSWPLLFAFLFIVTCVLYVIGNAIASLSTAILGRIVSNGSIGNPGVVALEGIKKGFLLMMLRTFLFWVDFLLFLVFLLLILKFALWLTILIMILWVIILIIYIFRLNKICQSINKIQQNKNKEETERDSIKSLVDRLLEKIIGRLHDEIQDAFIKKFEETFDIEEQGDELKRTSGEESQEKTKEKYKYDVTFPLTYMRNNNPSVFFQIKRYHMLYNFSQNMTGSFLFALFFYIGFYAFADLTVFKDTIIIEKTFMIWWGVIIWSMGNIFLMRYLRTYYNTCYKYIIKAFVALQSSKKKK